MAKTYTLHVAGLTRELPICKINDHLDIAAFIMFSDVELTIACAKALLKKWGVPNAENLRGVGNCILGYAAEGGKKAPAPRKENYVVLVK